MVVEEHELAQALWGQGGEVGLAWKASTQSAGGVLDAALLPWGVGVAEEGLNAQGLTQPVVRTWCRCRR